MRKKENAPTDTVQMIITYKNKKNYKTYISPAKINALVSLLLSQLVLWSADWGGGNYACCTVNPTWDHNSYQSSSSRKQVTK